jgi:hypothetical protein
MNVSIVVVAYNRPDSLKRLLNSIACASYEGFDDVPLIISIDGGGDPAVAAVAHQFQWQFGEKEIYSHRMNLGLKTHVLSAGDRTCDYDGIIMLEDDLMVSPLFYRYGSRALEAYQNNEMIAGVSLYSYRYLDVNGLFFLPSAGNGNTFLVKFPSSWGQAWTTRQWQEFRGWLGSARDNDCPDLDSKLPTKVASWPATSWKKSFARYLVDSNKYIVYPDTSLTTNMGNAGHHWQHSTLILQVPLQFAPTGYRFTDPSRAISYDQFFELESRSLEVLGYSGDIPAGVEFDLYGQKPSALIADKLVISSKQPNSGIRSYGMELLPHELNIVYEVQGREFHLGEGSEFDCGSLIPRTDLIKHQTASLGGHDLTKLLVMKLLGKMGVKAWQ